MQRVVDVALSALALLMLAPILVPVALLLRLTGEGKIFFVQERVGQDGRRFGLYKFATMLENSPNLGTGTITLKDDPRILPVGRILRKTKVNELPQLLNILLGHMSVVGPRPQTQRCFDAFPPATQAAILKVRPGLTGIGSVVFRSEEEMMHTSRDPANFYDQVIAPYKGALEEWYVEHQDLRTYLLLILITAWVVLVPRSSIVWRVFPTLPAPPSVLRVPLGAERASDPQETA